MSLSIEKHLEGISVENMLEFRAEQFSMYASARGIKLGFLGNGQYAVKDDQFTYTFDSPDIAIQKYKQLVRE